MKHFLTHIYNYLAWTFGKSKGELKYIKGDATIPVNDNVIICHSCNNVGQFSAGFVAPLKKRYPEVQVWYRRLFAGGRQAELGYVQYVPTEDCFIANMIAQDNTGKSYPPARLDALEECLMDVILFCYKNKIKDVQMPKIMTGIGSEKWENVEKVIKRTLIEYNINVTVFEL